MGPTSGPAGVRRVLMTTDAVGGVWNYAVQLAHRLGAAGIDVTLACLGPQPSAVQRTGAQASPRVRLETKPGRLEWMEHPWPDVEAAGAWLLDLARRDTPDLVHLNGYCHATLPWNAPTLVVGHSCVRSWWRAVRRCEPPPAYQRYLENVAAGLRAATLVVAPTRAMLSSLRDDYGPIGRGLVIRNGCDAARFGPARKRPIVFGAGRLWDEAKNLEALDAVAGELPWPVFVAGEGEHPDGGRVAFRRATSLGRLGPDDLALWMAETAIYALPARYEPFGLSVLEAARSSCALVLGDIPTLRELWDGAAVFVDPEDLHALRDAIARLARDEAERTRLSAAAARRARSLTADCTARRYLATYAGLVH